MPRHRRDFDDPDAKQVTDLLPIPPTIPIV